MGNSSNRRETTAKAKAVAMEKAMVENVQHPEKVRKAEVVKGKAVKAKVAVAEAQTVLMPVHRRVIKVQVWVQENLVTVKVNSETVLSRGKEKVQV